jgi:hypothetical protein
MSSTHTHDCDVQTQAVIDLLTTFTMEQQTTVYRMLAELLTKPDAV